MAIEILRAMSFECGDTQIPSADIGHGGASITNTSHTGTYGMRIGSDGSDYGRVPIPGAPVDPSVSVWVYPSYAVSDICRLRYLLNTGEDIELRWNAVSHTFDAYVDGGLVEAGTITVSASGYFHCQFYVVIDDDPAVGGVFVKIHGHESIHYHGDTKIQAGTTGATYLYFYGGASGAYSASFDDLVIGSGGYLGDLRCVDMMPEADTAQDDWTPSAGDNYSTIDEIPPSDADYNETNVDAQADELALTGFDGATYVPVAATAWIRAREEAATGDSIKVGYNSNGTVDVTEHTLETSYVYYFHTNDENPDGPAAWDDAALEALLLRYESVIA